VSVEEVIAEKYARLRDVLDERARRLWAGVEAESLGRGGIAAVARATGMAISTVTRGRNEARAEQLYEHGRVRREGGGRRAVKETQQGLVDALQSLVDPVTRGDPESPLRWTCKSLQKLADELSTKGFKIGKDTVGKLLRELGYSLQATHKTIEGNQHPDRNSQFEFLNERVKTMQRRGLPAISVDTKKKELVGDFTNKGREWNPYATPERVQVHDFPPTAIGRAIPYGIYDIASNSGWVSVGVDHDTPAFAVKSIETWWDVVGSERYPGARELLITADAGGSNGHRPRLWKVELQRFADRSGLTLHVSHFPPGTSKWNKIEHRLFSFISQNWRGRPLTTYETIVELIAATTTREGLTVQATLDTRRYPTGVKVTDRDMQDLNLQPCFFHGDWNYTIHPRASAFA
jgi:transposase